MATLHLFTSKRLEYPISTYGELHVDAFMVELPRTQAAPTGFTIKAGFMDRNQTTGKKEWANPDQDSRATQCYAHNNLDELLAANSDLAALGQQAIMANMAFIAAVLSKFRSDDVGTVTAEVRQ